MSEHPSFKFKYIQTLQIVENHDRVRIQVIQFPKDELKEQRERGEIWFGDFKSALKKALLQWCKVNEVPNDDPEVQRLFKKLRRRQLGDVSYTARQTSDLMIIRMVANMYGYNPHGGSVKPNFSNSNL